MTSHCKHTETCSQEAEGKNAWHEPGSTKSDTCARQMALQRAEVKTV